MKVEIRYTNEEDKSIVAYSAELINKDDCDKACEKMSELMNNLKMVMPDGKKKFDEWAPWAYVRKN